MSFKLRHNQNAYERADGTTLIAGKCVFTGKEHQVIVPSSELDRWCMGMAIQDAMPNVSEGDREFLISGVSPEGWAETFNDDEDDMSEYKDVLQTLNDAFIPEVEKIIGEKYDRTNFEHRAAYFKWLESRFNSK